MGDQQVHLKTQLVFITNDSRVGYDFLSQCHSKLIWILMTHGLMLLVQRN